ncbi:hypothetical protein TEA_019044 [Camellia sinensis var. sinensis]|uniref:Ankyrin repeat domain-containing protein 54 n=1 Tax=Camellia sinensis var. sinensis TaxID=542762 RepID=A0A4S4ES00_CAMSN|nr:hypothetical protein TEA_019044 [Camellia sinensis var. sinensis]
MMSKVAIEKFHISYPFKPLPPLSLSPRCSFLSLSSIQLAGHSHFVENVILSSDSQFALSGDSEYDDDNEGNNLDFEEEEESVSSATASYSADKPSTTTDISAEDLLKEVEQLLGLEERDILQQNATPNLGKISTAKWNPFHSLGLAGQIHYMDMLLGNGLHIDLADKDGMTALHTAIIGKKEAVVSHLLRKGANPNIRDRDGASPLHYAVQVGAMQTVKILIKYNVDVNASDNEGWTPLHIAIQTRNRDIAKVILVNGADKTRRNKDGKTPLDLALCYGKDFKSYDLAKLLKLVPANRYLRLLEDELGNGDFDDADIRADFIEIL